MIEYSETRRNKIFILFAKKCDDFLFLLISENAETFNFRFDDFCYIGITIFLRYIERRDTSREVTFSAPFEVWINDVTLCIEKVSEMFYSHI